MKLTYAMKIPLNIDRYPANLTAGFSVPCLSVSYIEHPDRNGGKQDSDDEHDEFEGVVSFFLVHVN